MSNNSDKIKLSSTLACPACGHRETEEMPTDSCLFFWTCPNCLTLLKPKGGDCCVYCSYGDVPCPSVLEGKNC